MQGAGLTLVDAGDGTRRLATGRTRDPAGVQTKVMAVVRGAAVRTSPGGKIPPDFEAVLQWLEAAPSLKDLIDAIGGAKVVDEFSDKPCKPKCTPKERAVPKNRKPPCCPSW